MFCFCLSHLFCIEVTERERDVLARREGVFGLASLLGVEISCPLSMTASTSQYCKGQSYRDDTNAKEKVKKMVTRLV